MKNNRGPELPLRIADPADFFDKRFVDPNPWDLSTSAFERRKYLRQIWALREFASPSFLLELGSAEGAFTEMVTAEFPKLSVDAVEISLLATQRARTRLQALSDRVRIHNSDIADFLTDATPKGWDVIVWSECMHYLARSRTMAEFIHLIHQCLKLLTPGGYLCSVNTTKAISEPHDPLTTEILAATLCALRTHANCRMWCAYVDYKPEEGLSWEYELWLFQVP